LTNSLNILIAGTSSAYLEMSRQILRFHHDDCEVDFAHSGEECLDKIHSYNYDLLLLDFDLGDGNALEILKDISRYNGETSVVVLVENRDEHFGRQCVASGGACDYMI